MSAAKRKPARRGTRATSARKRLPARRKSAKPERCSMPVARLAQVFDRDEVRDEVLAHVPGCVPCTTSLTVLAAQRQGIKSLVVDSEGGTAVERVLARGLQESTRKLADLVYELAKACLVVVQDIDRRLHLERRPRDQQVIEREVRGVTSRLPARDRQVLNGLPHVKPSEETALVAAESCIRILERVEGATERQRLSWAVWLICAGREPQAEVELRDGLSRGVFADNSIHAMNNLLWSLNRQGKFTEMLSAGAPAARKFPDSWLVQFNAAVAASHCGKRSEFRTFARKLRTLHRRAKGIDFERQEEHMLHEVPWIAEELRTSADEVANALGLAYRRKALVSNGTR